MSNRRLVVLEREVEELTKRLKQTEKLLQAACEALGHLQMEDGCPVPFPCSERFFKAQAAFLAHAQEQEETKKV